MEITTKGAQERHYLLGALAEVSYELEKRRNVLVPLS